MCESDYLQVFGLEETELQEVARHMGHELAVHRKFYRLQDDVIELAKVSKLLLAVEAGKAHTFSGMSIDDIDLKGMNRDNFCWPDVWEKMLNCLNSIGFLWESMGYFPFLPAYGIGCRPSTICPLAIYKIIFS